VSDLPAARPLAARRGGGLAAAALGALAAFGLAPLGLWPLTLVGLIGLAPLVIDAPDGRVAALRGWAFAVGYFAHGLHWIVEPFLVEPERHGWMAPFALVLMAGGLALFWAAAAGAAHRLGTTRGGRLVALILALSLAEFARAYVLSGFPWAALAQVWVDTPLRLSLAWIGPHGLALATLLATLPLGAAVSAPGRMSLRLSAGLPGLALLTGALALAAASGPAPQAPGAPVVRLVQPNAAQDQKWDPAYAPVFLDRQIDFTAAGPVADLVVWPEAAVATYLHRARPVFERIAEAARGAPVALGINRVEGFRIYNSLAVVGDEAELAGLYDKHHLVPFGEYFPLGDLAARVGISGLAAEEGRGFSAGPGPRLLDLGPLGRALPLICYEAVFPDDVGGAAERPDFLLQVTNDAWFGARSGPYQHLAQSRMRAAEQGLPMVRAANTGVSAMIDAQGRLVAALPLNEAGWLDATLPPPLAPTLYSRSGDLPVFVLLLVGVLCFLLLNRRPGRSDSD
jgi:apolipoprotein N-acyltransferase